MHRAFRPAVAIIVVLLIVQVSAMFSFTWASPSRGTSIALNEGALRIWRCAPGDWAFLTRPFYSSWRFSRAYQWRPVLVRSQIAVPVGPNDRSGATAKMVSGLHIVLPLYVPLLPALALAAAALPAHRRRRRIGRGHCSHCGYDLHGMKPGVARCPECGQAVTLSG